MDDVGALEGVPAEALEALRGALAAMLGRGDKVTVRRLASLARARTQHAQLVVAAYRGGKLAVTPTPPTDGAGDVDLDEKELTPELLAEQLQDVDSHEAHLKAAGVVMRAIALGKVSPAVGKALLDVLKETRQGIKGAAAEGAGELEQLVPCTAEGAQLVALFESITSDARRAAIVEHVRAQLALDLIEGPNAMGIAAPSERAAGAAEPVDGETR